MLKCGKCKKEKDVINFTKRESILKTCVDCRKKNNENNENYRKQNKEVISLYNKMYNTKKSNISKTCLMLYAKRLNEDTWIEFKSQAEAARELNLYASNIGKVIKGDIKTTGGYMFKTESVTVKKQDIPSWEEIKKNNNIKSKVKGVPSKHRILHEERNNVMGKRCCTCKEWRELYEYNKSATHWDNLRNDCKNCLVIWRKENREKLTKKNLIYEKNRKMVDPEFKLVKILRSRLNSALNRRNIQKGFSTMELTGCELPFLKEYLEAKFTEGMSWKNHGDWHIDHIKPCCSFDLKNEEEQKKCFHYTNLQPLWATENLTKGGKY